MLPLANTLAIFKATLDGNSMVLKNKEQVAEVGNYLVEWLVTVAILMDKSMPAVVSLWCHPMW